MKRVLYSILFITIIGGAGYGTYYYLNNQKPVQAWDLVPDRAIMVYETDNLISSWNSLQENPVWKELLSIESINKLKSDFESLDSISGSNGSFAAFFKNSRVLASLHKSARDQFDFVLYHNLKQAGQLQFINSLKDSVSIFGTSTREYEGFKIHEFKEAPSKVSFAYVIIDGNFVGSYNPILIEDVIRYVKSKSAGFKSLKDELFSISNLQDDLGNLYFNMDLLDQFFYTFLNKNSDFTKLLGNFASAAFLDLNAEEDKILLNGYSLATGDSSHYLTIFKDQQAVEMGFENYIPNQTAYVTQFSFSEPDRWISDHIKYFNQLDPAFLKQQQNLEASLDMDFDLLNATLRSEIGKAVVNSTTSEDEYDQFVYIKSKDINETLKIMNNLASSSASVNEDTVYFEQYASVEIKEIKVKEFPYKWLGPLFKGYSHTFFAVFNDYIILSNSIQSIKSLIQDMENENTWGKSIKVNQFLESCLQNSNLNVFINTTQALPLLFNSLNERWSTLLKDNQSSLSTLEMLAIQFSFTKEGYYTNIETQYYEPLLAEDFNYYETVYSNFTKHPITAKPYVVRNHNNNQFETLVLDSANNLYLFDSQGNKLWTEQLGEPIVGDIQQLDFYKNGKLQYVFATKNKIHIVDRNGIYVENYPVLINSNSPLEYFNLIDYDKSKNYRLMAATLNGDIYLMDKSGEFLGEWNPLSLGDRLTSSPNHVRIRNKDFMIGVQRKGVINVMNRNSSMKPDFPVALNDRVSGNVFYELGNNINSSYIVVITNGGELVKVSFSGNQQQKKQLYKPSKETIFNIIPDASNRSYILARQDQERLSILQANGELIFEKDYLSGTELSVQYYNFESDKKIIAVTDKKQNFTYLYTGTGDLIHSQPTESSHEIAILYYSRDNEFRVFKTFGNLFSVQKFNY